MCSQNLDMDKRTDYPMQRSDGKWVIGYDDNCNPVILDDIDQLDTETRECLTWQQKENGIDWVAFKPQASCTAVPSSTCTTDGASTTVTDNSTIETGTDANGIFVQLFDPQVCSEVFFDKPATPTEQHLPLVPWQPPGDFPSGDTFAVPLVADPQPGLVGLSNLGNTCFINAALQCLFANTQLIDYFFNKFATHDARRSLPNNSLSSCFLALFYKVWSSRTEHVMRPSEFKETLGQTFSQFQGCRQHDAQEFLTLLLGTLHDQILCAYKQHSMKTSSLDKPLSLLPFAGTDSPISAEHCSSATSPKSTDSLCTISSASSTSDQLNDDEDHIRSHPIPDTFKNFDANLTQLSTSPLKHFGGSRAPITGLNNQLKDKNCNLPLSEQQLELKESGLLHVVDLVKETKTANTNVLIENEPNNAINFNSCKFPRKKELVTDKLDNLRTELPLEHLESGGSLQSNKLIVLDTHENSAKKRVNECINELSQLMEDPIARSPKRLKCDEDEQQCKLAELHWNRYLNNNESIIVNNFQGQFKSTVRCDACAHVSITYEPFMYLAVPLPYALDVQLVITFQPLCPTGWDARLEKPRKFLINCNKHDLFEKAYDQLKSLLLEEQLITPEAEVELAEVEDNYVCGLIDRCQYIQSSIPKNRTLYAYELTHLPFALNDKTTSFSGDNLALDLQTLPTAQPRSGLFLSPSSSFDPNAPKENPELEMDTYNQIDGLLLRSINEKVSSDLYDCCDFDAGADMTITSLTNAQLSPIGPEAPVDSNDLKCNICLEEKFASQLLAHANCQCRICSTCLDLTVQHLSADKHHFDCPICALRVNKSMFCTAPQTSQVPKQQVRYLSIPVLFRIEAPGAFTKFKLALPPMLLRLPSLVNVSELYAAIDKFVPFACAYSLHFVGRNGQICSRCAWDCSGCEVARFGQATITADDRIVVQFDEQCLNEIQLLQAVPAELLQVKPHSSMQQLRTEGELTLYDCIKAFNQCETLDEDNPWYCPSCESYQKAKKSLCIWKCPPTLMIYLKRFMFHEMSSVKVENAVEYPLANLKMREYVQGPQDEQECTYNLQGIVCHSGGVNSGHYTAYAKHFLSEKWHYLNDEQVTEQTPDVDDKRAYILFYQTPHSLPKDMFSTPSDTVVPDLPVENEVKTEIS